jgi:DNA-binding XRE family transcriptional regulator
MSVVYFVACGQAFKVGCTAENLESRLRAVRTHCSMPIRFMGTIPGDIDTEKDVHDSLHLYRSHGEWFAICDGSRRVLRDLGVDSEADLPAPPVAPFRQTVGGNRLREWRKAQRLTQAELGALLGVSNPMANKVETGERRPSRELALVIQERCGIDLGLWSEVAS